MNEKFGVSDEQNANLAESYEISLVVFGCGNGWPGRGSRGNGNNLTLAKRNGVSTTTSTSSDNATVYAISIGNG